MSNSNRISLEQSLKAYQVMHSPSKFSWKQHWAKEKFSSADMFNCSDEEQEQFKKRLKECTITMCGGIKALSGDVVTLDKVVSTITDVNNKNMSGIFHDIAPNGGLILKTEKETQTFLSAELTKENFI